MTLTDTKEHALVEIQEESLPCYWLAVIQQKDTHKNSLSRKRS